MFPDHYKVAGPPWRHYKALRRGKLCSDGKVCCSYVDTANTSALVSHANAAHERRAGARFTPVVLANDLLDALG